MIRTVYKYKGKTYTSEYQLRNAIWVQGRTVFGSAPAKDSDNYQQFWNNLGVDIVEEEVAQPQTETVIPDDKIRQVKQNEINQYKQMLSNTDYVVTKLSEFKTMYPNQQIQYEAMYKNYASVLQQRTQWRAKINQLEKELLEI